MRCFVHPPSRHGDLLAAAPTIDRLLRAKGDMQAAMARRIVAAGVPWGEAAPLFTTGLHSDPQGITRAVQALAAAADQAGDPHVLARLRLMHGKALSRTGDSLEASRLFLLAAPQLETFGDHVQAVQSVIFAVNALAYGGEIQQALRCAKRARAMIRGPHSAHLRATLSGNLASVLRLAGQLEAAVREGDRSARAFERLGLPAVAATPRMNAGVALMYAGHVERARTRLEAARDAFEEHALEDGLRYAEYNLACLAVRVGHVGRAIRALETLAAGAQADGRVRFEAQCRMDLSDALRRSGDAATAAREAEAAAAGFEASGAVAEAIEAHWLAACAYSGYDSARARRALAQARRRARAQGREELVLRIALLTFDMSMRNGKSIDGRLLARHIARAKHLGQHETAWHLELLRAERDLTSGARSRARQALDRLPRTTRRHPWIATARATLRARLDMQSGDLSAGIRRLRTITRQLDDIRGGLPGAWLQTTFLIERLDPYLLLVDALLERGRAPDRREAEETLDALALKRYLSGRSPQRLQGVARVRRRLELLYDRLADGESSTRGLNPAQRSALLTEVDSLQRKVADAWRSGERRGHPGARAPASRSTIAAGAFIHIWCRGPDVRALIRQGGAVVNLGVIMPAATLRKRVFELQFHAHRVRATGSASAATLLDRALEELSGTLLGPIALELGRGRVRLVLDGTLPDVPWELLPLHGRPLAAQVSLARVPAARIPWRRRSAGEGTRVFVSGERGLPAITREALHVADGESPCRGPFATRVAAAEALQSKAVVHMAMHGVAAPHAPAFGGVRMSDGWFTAADVPDRVAVELVSLAACHTGAPPGPAAQAWGALPSALLRAGARWVLWTSGDVDDETTADLMSAIHPVSDFDRVPEILGQALERVAAQQGTAARLLPFRLSGGHA